jgi:hypothetical protein
MSDGFEWGVRMRPWRPSLRALAKQSSAKKAAADRRLRVVQARKLASRPGDKVGE